jgi:hypothetical protein
MEFGFYLILICRYLVVYKGVVISNNYLDLAMLFFDSNELLALALIFFGMVFNSFHYAIKETISWLVSGGPLWFVVLWVAVYFPQCYSRVAILNTSKLLSYGHFYSLTITLINLFFFVIVMSALVFSN